MSKGTGRKGGREHGQGWTTRGLGERREGCGFYFIVYFLKDFYLFIIRELGKEGEREEKKHQCVVASHAPPYWGPGLQPRHVP